MLLYLVMLDAKNFVTRYKSLLQIQILISKIDISLSFITNNKIDYLVY